MRLDLVRHLKVGLVLSIFMPQTLGTIHYDAIMVIIHNE